MSAYFSHFICSYPAYIPFGGIKVRLTIYIRTNVLPFFSIVCSSYIFPTIRWRFAEFIKSCVGKRVRAIPFIHNVFISSAQYCMSPNSGSQIMNRDS